MVTTAISGHTSGGGGISAMIAVYFSAPFHFYCLLFTVLANHPSLNNERRRWLPYVWIFALKGNIRCSLRSQYFKMRPFDWFFNTVYSWYCYGFSAKVKTELRWIQTHALSEREQRALATLARPWSPTNYSKKKIYSLPPNMTGISSRIA